jgi:hypothetical protein
MTPITPADKDLCIQLKASYGLEHLHFYYYNSKYSRRGALHCKYISDVNDFVTEDPVDLQFILNALARGQCKIVFDGSKRTCVGIDDLKSDYLIFRLAGL